MPESTPNTLEIETAIQITKPELLMAARGRCLSSAATEDSTAATAAAPINAAAAAVGTSDETASLIDHEINFNQMQYNDKMRARWWWIIYPPILLVCLLGPFLIQRHGPWWLLGITMFLCFWSLWTGTQDFNFIIIQLNLPANLVFGDDETKVWAPVAATTLTIFIFQALCLHGRLQQTTSSISAYKYHASSYPLPTLPVTYTAVFVVMMISALLVLWADAFYLLRWTMQGLATLTASAALILLVEFALFLGGVDGCWRSRHFMLQNHRASKTLFSLVMLTSMTAVLLSPLASDGWVRLAYYYAFVNTTLVASTIQTTGSTRQFNETTFAKGYFTPTTRRRSMYVLTAFFVSALAIWMPLIATMVYKSSQTALVTAEDWYLMILQITAFIVSMACLIALSVVISRMKPLHWTISTAGCFVLLSVETVGMTRRYYQVIDASKGSFLPSLSARRSHITNVNNRGGVVVVKYNRLAIWRRHDSKYYCIQMTPEDPDVFMEMMALAIEHVKRPSGNCTHSEDVLGEKSA